jgi:hypothetical protein
MRIVELGPIHVTLTEEEIIADLIYPAREEGDR